jgi:hypothetical protein
MTESRLLPNSVVEDFDVFRDLGSSLLAGSEAAAIDELGFL